MLRREPPDRPSDKAANSRHEGADPNARATFWQKDQTHGNVPTEALHGITPVGYARRYSNRRCVNSQALAAVIERGGNE